MASREASSTSSTGAAASTSRPELSLKTPQMTSLSWTSGKDAAARDKPYSDPEPDPYSKAVEYLETHHIIELFQVYKNCYCSIIY